MKEEIKQVDYEKLNKIWEHQNKVFMELKNKISELSDFISNSFFKEWGGFANLDLNPKEALEFYDKISNFLNNDFQKVFGGLSINLKWINSIIKEHLMMLLVNTLERKIKNKVGN